MGLLDEAIKEHLELKRRRGADPGEVAREEAEALGPVRRGEPEPAQAAVEPEPEQSEAYREPEPEPEAYREPEPERHREPEPEPAAHAHHATEDEEIAAPHGDPFGDEALGHHERAVHREAIPEPESETATPPHGDPLAHQPTREFRAEELSEALGHEPGPPAELVPPTAPSAEAVAGGDPDVVPADEEGEDVLEETPEFLQETPEHDRLWFEQKPPKDFDF